MRPRWTTTAPPTGNGRWLTSRLCALGLMVEEDDAAEILGRASYAGFSPEAGASAIAATNIVLDRARSERRFAAAPTSGTSGPAGPGGYETWTVTTFGGSDNRLPVANGITGIVMPSANALSPLLSGGYTSVQEMVAVTEITADLVLNRD